MNNAYQLKSKMRKNKRKIAFADTESNRSCGPQTGQMLGVQQALTVTAGKSCAQRAISTPTQANVSPQIWLARAGDDRSFPIV